MSGALQASSSSSRDRPKQPLSARARLGDMAVAVVVALLPCVRAAT